MTTARTKRALEKLDAWIEKQGFKGWDPHDALNSPVLQRIARYNRLAGIALVQLVRRSPLNLRPILGVQKGFNPKAMGLFLTSFAEKFAATRRKDDLERVRFFGDWLIEHAAQGYAGPCWGYNFDWPNRGFFAPVGTPTIVNTAFIALAFLGAESALNNSTSSFAETDLKIEQRAVHRIRFEPLSIARGACEFILNDLNVLHPSSGEICFSYTPLDRRFVHNANLLGAWLLAAVYDRTGKTKFAESAVEATRFTVCRQNMDGSWCYGIAKRDQWVDNFHTGYVLVALRNIGRYLKTDEFEAAALRGYDYWRERMFLSNLIPKYYPHSVFPIDIHCIAQAILTHLEFCDVNPGALNQADRLCQWTINNLQDAEGFFYYQLHRRYKVNIPYMRWGQAWMQLALTKLVYGLEARACPDVSLAARC